MAAAKSLKKMTAADLAKELNVSAATLSYALNGRPGVSDRLREHIVKAALEKGIVSESDIGGPAKTRLLGLILADIENPFYPELAVSASDFARKIGYEVVLSHTDDKQTTVRSAVSMLVNLGVDGIILTTTQLGDAELAREMRGTHVPCTQLSRYVEGIGGSFVGINDYEAGYEMMAHVLSHGYKKICVAAGPSVSSASASRARGFSKAMDDAGLRIQRNLKLTTRLGYAGGVSVAEHLLSLNDKLPEVVVCGTDAIALGLIGTLARHGINCPEDIAVTGFDGLTSAKWGTTDLTTVVQPRAKMGKTAVEQLIHAVSDNSWKGEYSILDYSMYIGRTCGCKREG